MYSDQIKSSVFVIRTKQVCLQTRHNDDSDRAHLTSFGIEFQTEEEAKENEQSPSAALLSAGLLRRRMVCELERVLRVSNGLSEAYHGIAFNGTVLL